MRVQHSYIQCFTAVILAVLPITTLAQVTGNGNANYVAKFSGSTTGAASTTLGNSAIVESSGNVGIGTNSAGPATLTINSSNAGTNFAGMMNGYGPYYAFTTNNVDANNGGLTVRYLRSSSLVSGMTLNDSGIGGMSNGYGPFFMLSTNNIDGNNGGLTVKYLNQGNLTSGLTLNYQGNIGISGSITFADGSTQSTAWTGTLCGGDYAESIDVSGDRETYGPGDVLQIDDNNPSHFLKVTEPYSTAVAGVYSTRPGALGRRQTSPKRTDEVPLAMIGIVPVKVSAENGPIRPHDLLVSSSKPGYAMRGTDRNKMLGAVIGKAMGSLETGTGVIEVLVTLQ